mmetsp:Transcript_74138/g.224737  ORF Transcript_74138/g.224737 Transcript_74138/m.224737 type:complete len:319 (-) Transcript_74138:376-1332(-)
MFALFPVQLPPATAAWTDQGLIPHLGDHAPGCTSRCPLSGCRGRVPRGGLLLLHACGGEAVRERGEGERARVRRGGLHGVVDHGGLALLLDGHHEHGGLWRLFAEHRRLEGVHVPLHPRGDHGRLHGRLGGPQRHSGLQRAAAVPRHWEAVPAVPEDPGASDAQKCGYRGAGEIPAPSWPRGFLGKAPQLPPHRAGALPVPLGRCFHRLPGRPGIRGRLVPLHGLCHDRGLRRCLPHHAGRAGLGLHPHRPERLLAGRHHLGRGGAQGDAEDPAVARADAAAAAGQGPHPQAGQGRPGRGPAGVCHRHAHGPGCRALR